MVCCWCKKSVYFHHPRKEKSYETAKQCHLWTSEFLVAPPSPPADDGTNEVLFACDVERLERLQRQDHRAVRVLRRLTGWRFSSVLGRSVRLLKVGCNGLRMVRQARLNVVWQVLVPWAHAKQWNLCCFYPNETIWLLGFAEIPFEKKCVAVGRSVCSRGIWKITKNFDGFRDSRHLSDFQNMSEMGRCGWLEVMYPQKTLKMVGSSWKPMDFVWFCGFKFSKHINVECVNVFGERSVMRSILVLHLIWSASPRWTRNFPSKLMLMLESRSGLPCWCLHFLSQFIYIYSFLGGLRQKYHFYTWVIHPLAAWGCLTWAFVGQDAADKRSYQFHLKVVNVKLRRLCRCPLNIEKLVWR